MTKSMSLPKKAVMAVSAVISAGLVGTLAVGLLLPRPLPVVSSRTRRPSATPAQPTHQSHSLTSVSNRPFLPSWATRSAWPARGRSTA